MWEIVCFRVGTIIVGVPFTNVVAKFFQLLKVVSYGWLLYSCDETIVHDKKSMMRHNPIPSRGCEQRHPLLPSIPLHYFLWKSKRKMMTTTVKLIFPVKIDKHFPATDGSLYDTITKFKVEKKLETLIPPNSNGN